MVQLRHNDYPSADVHRAVRIGVPKDVEGDTESTTLEDIIHDRQYATLWDWVTAHTTTGNWNPSDRLNKLFQADVDIQKLQKGIAVLDTKRSVLVTRDLENRWILRYSPQAGAYPIGMNDEGEGVYLEVNDGCLILTSGNRSVLADVSKPRDFAVTSVTIGKESEWLMKCLSTLVLVVHGIG